MKVAVVGAGLFGCTTAVELARAGHQVTLYDRNGSILHGATRANCGRIHRGYHYPRSEPTARATMAAADEFAARFAGAVHTGAWHYYAVARDSRVGAEQYLAFLDRLGLPYRIAHPGWVYRGAVDVVVQVPESLLDVRALRGQLQREVTAAGVTLRLGVAGHAGMPGFDLTVLATYGAHATRPLRFEVTEVAVVRLGLHLAGRSLVVLDGPYACLDPLPGTGEHLLYDVAHSVHHANVGYTAEIPEHLAPLVDAGQVYTGHSRAAAMQQTLRRFVDGVGMPGYCGSLFTVRAVLPGVDATDERPTLVERDGDVITVLSGKLDTALVAARQVAAQVELVAA